MNRLHTLLAATDLSAHAERAARRAAILGDWLLGSVTRHVMAQVHCDVLMLPATDA